MRAYTSAEPIAKGIKMRQESHNGISPSETELSYRRRKRAYFVVCGQ